MSPLQELCTRQIHTFSYCLYGVAAVEAGGDGVSKGLVTDYWGYGCAVLRNARRNIEKHNRVIRKYVEYVSLEEVADKPAWQGRLAYRAKALRLREPCVICFMDQEIEFLHRTLFVALSRLDRMRLHIVLLYYVLEKTDEEIYQILHIKSRSLVQYHRTAAIRQLRQWIGEMEDEYDLL